MSLIAVVDVYQSWCGPTVSLTGTFRKYRMETGDKLLHYAIVSCDNGVLLWITATIIYRCFAFNDSLD